MKFSLNEKQMQRFKKWREEIITPAMAEATVEERCSVASPFTFEFRDTGEFRHMGIGTTLYVHFGNKHTLDLSQDDDGEFFEKTLGSKTIDYGNTPVYILLEQPEGLDGGDLIEDQLCGTFTTSEAAIKEGCKRAKAGASGDFKAHVRQSVRKPGSTENLKWRIEIDDEPCYIVVRSTPE